jgi:hypothetical protein
MLGHVALVRTAISEELNASIHNDDRGDKFLWNVGSYRSHTA